METVIYVWLNLPCVQVRLTYPISRKKLSTERVEWWTTDVQPVTTLKKKDAKLTNLLWWYAILNAIVKDQQSYMLPKTHDMIANQLLKLEHYALVIYNLSAGSAVPSWTTWTKIIWGNWKMKSYFAFRHFECNIKFIAFCWKEILSGVEMTKRVIE